MIDLKLYLKQHFGARSALFMIVVGVAAGLMLYLSYVWLSGPADFGVYLSSAQALLNQQNPWDAAQLTSIAHANGNLPFSLPVFGLWTPPLAMLLLIPFTNLLYPVAAWLWLALNIALLWCNARVLQRWLPFLHLVRGEKFLWLFFPPLIALLVWGQIPGLVLTGYVFFVYFAQQRRDVLAGSSLLLTILKPHLGYLALLFIIWWIIRQRRWVIAISFIGSLGCTLILIFLIHPNWLAEYQAAIAMPPLIYNAATFFQILRSRFFPTQDWVQFLGLPVSAVGLFFYLWRRQEPPDLLPTTMALLLYSVVFAPYGWVYDQIVTLPIFLWLMQDFFGKHPAWWVWTLVLILYAAYYFQFATGAIGTNDSRVFWFPLLLAVVWSFQNWRRKADSPHLV